MADKERSSLEVNQIIPYSTPSNVMLSSFLAVAQSFENNEHQSHFHDCSSPRDSSSPYIFFVPIMIPGVVRVDWWGEGSNEEAAGWYQMVSRKKLGRNSPSGGKVVYFVNFLTWRNLSTNCKTGEFFFFVRGVFKNVDGANWDPQQGSHLGPVGGGNGAPVQVFDAGGFRLDGKPVSSLSIRRWGGGRYEKPRPQSPTHFIHPTAHCAATTSNPPSGSRRSSRIRTPSSPTSVACNADAQESSSHNFTSTQKVRSGITAL